MIKSLRTVLVFAKVNTLRFFRDPLALFFTIAFPLIFLFVFGGIFGGNSGDVSFKVAMINQSQTDFSKKFVEDTKSNKLFKVTEVGTLDDAMEFLVAGASALQVGTANFYDPTAAVRIVDALPAALGQLGATSVRDIVGTLAS